MASALQYNAVKRGLAQSSHRGPKLRSNSNGAPVSVVNIEIGVVIPISSSIPDLFLARSPRRLSIKRRVVCPGSRRSSTSSVWSLGMLHENEVRGNQNLEFHMGNSNSSQFSLQGTVFGMTTLHNLTSSAALRREVVSSPLEISLP